MLPGKAVVGGVVAIRVLLVELEVALAQRACLAETCKIVLYYQIALHCLVLFVLCMIRIVGMGTE